MKLSELLAGVALREALTPELGGLDVAGLEYDSRRVEKGFLFFAFPGSRVDGRQFAQDALTKGALAVASELPRPVEFAGVWIQVEHGRQALAVAARNFYHRPDERVLFTGITGTNGKTTTAYLIETLLRAAGKVTGLIGTIEYRLAGHVLPSPNTTPESLDIMRFASQLETRGGTHLITEVSSHALALGRVHGLRFHTAVFTNLTRDHLDFHGTMEEYGAAKRLLFKSPNPGQPGPRWAVLNADDPVSKTMQPGASGSRTIWYGLTDQADLRAENIISGFTGLAFDVTWNTRRAKVESPLLGQVNVSNILAALGAGLSYGLDLEAMAGSVAACRAVPGRFEPVDLGQPFLVAVDYAHTDDALRNAIQTARSLSKSRVITLFGCGGDRDRTKRPLMGMAAAELSDFVVLTSDNPRSEDPLSIMNDVMVGLRRFDTRHVAEPDRGKAIQLAIQEAQPDDVVLIAGKGHETYQVLKDRTIHFDDRETAREVLRSFGYKDKPE
ncbi:MAG TPA: UDP-N-acetylmuramoyl-L-alanyl-D-glutamate--2,6-diaminopimelate ligase [Bryobacteraceae bacterium]|jgi:UDP-N-acetylmuramoyl-L-alanyl-D-glutamate--2,6-diaminopimelate ligase|nr:UDP-N-acetylmuramoyl-L-alanyl-D-glutamate--2,6-diaminopimelate ligase [Bryobacteraceae bacterium]